MITGILIRTGLIVVKIFVEAMFFEIFIAPDRPYQRNKTLLRHLFVILQRYGVIIRIKLEKVALTVIATITLITG